MSLDQQRFAKTLRQNMTDAERLLWRHLRDHRLLGQKFRRQQPIGPYIVDFVHFGARLIVEADGGQHDDCRRDIVRDQWLEAQGFRVLRFWNNAILREPEAVLTRILEALEQASPPLPQPLSREGRGESTQISRRRRRPTLLTAERQQRAPRPRANRHESPSPLAGEGLGRGGGGHHQRLHEISRP